MEILPVMEEIPSTDGKLNLDRREIFTVKKRNLPCKEKKLT